MLEIFQDSVSTFQILLKASWIFSQLSILWESWRSHNTGVEEAVHSVRGDESYAVRGSGGGPVGRGDRAGSFPEVLQQQKVRSKTTPSRTWLITTTCMFCTVVELWRRSACNIVYRVTWRSITYLGVQLLLLLLGNTQLLVQLEVRDQKWLGQLMLLEFRINSIKDWPISSFHLLEKR